MASRRSALKLRQCHQKVSTRTLWQVLGPLAVAGASSGCASLAEERLRFIQGGHPGRIVQINAAPATSVRSARDRRAEDSSAAGGSRYALVKYVQSPSRYAFRVALLHESSVLAVDDRVEVNVHRCDLAMSRLETG